MEKVKPAGPFTQSLWNSIETVYVELINHPFVNQLAKGILSQNSFAHYLSQDILYIKDDAKALDKLSVKAGLENEKHFFKTLANDGYQIERELHNYFLKHFNVVEAQRKSPVIDEYTTFLLRHSIESSYAIAAAALLPCYWIYYAVGHHIVLLAADDNKYQKWIDTYKGGEFAAYTNTFIKIVEKLGDNATKTEKKLMQDAFIQATNLELNFFEEAIAK